MKSVRHHGFNDVVKGRILAGNYFLLREHYNEYFEQALKVRRLVSQDFHKAFQRVDLLLTPVTLSDAPRFSEFCSSDNRTQTAKNDYCTQVCPYPLILIKKVSRSFLISFSFAYDSYL